MKTTAIAPRNKWTGATVDVHFNWRSDGHGFGTQVVDFVRKADCPFHKNLGVDLEGTLPGKA